MKLKYLSLLASSFFLLSQNVQAMNDEEQSRNLKVTQQAQKVLKKGTAVKISGGSVIDISRISPEGIIAESDGHFQLGVRPQLEPMINTSQNPEFVAVAKRMLQVFESGRLFTPTEVSYEEEKDSLFRDRVRTLLRIIEKNFWNEEEQCPRELHAEGVAASLLTLERLKDLKTGWGPLSKSSSRCGPELEVAASSSSRLLPLAEGAIPVRTPGRIAIYRDGAPFSVLSFPGDFKLADTLREKRLGGHPLSVSITPEVDEIKGDGFNYYFTVSKEQMLPLNGATLRFQVNMRSNAPAYIEYWDGLKEIRSASHSGSDQWETLAVELTVNSDGAKWFNFYPAILSAVEGIENPSTQIRNCILHYRK
jgi:hypothetical protein